MDALSYASEYEARFLSSQNAYFPTELVQRCLQAYPLVEAPLPRTTASSATSAPTGGAWRAGTGPSSRSSAWTGRAWGRSSG